MILVFLMLCFKPAFSLSSFTFIKRLFSSSLLSAMRVVPSVYLRLLIFLLAIFVSLINIHNNMRNILLSKCKDSISPSSTLWIVLCTYSGAHCPSGQREGSNRPITASFEAITLTWAFWIVPGKQDGVLRNAYAHSLSLILDEQVILEARVISVLSVWQRWCWAPASRGRTQNQVRLLVLSPHHPESIKCSFLQHFPKKKIIKHSSV